MIFKSHFNSIMIFDSLYKELDNFCQEGLIYNNITYNDYIFKFLNECLNETPFKICTDCNYGDFEVFVDESKVINYLINLDLSTLGLIRREWKNIEVIGTSNSEYVKLFNIITRRFTEHKDFISRLCKYVEKEWSQNQKE